MTDTESAGVGGAEIEPVSLARRAITLIGILVPFGAAVFAIVSLWGKGVDWIGLALLIGMYLASGLGITVGYHRHFVHRSFETVAPIKFVLAVLGSMAVEGPLLQWAAVHRRHHQHSDDAGDPHSPHYYGGGVRGVLLGLCHAHIGWMFKPSPANLDRYVQDLAADGVVRTASRLFPLWAIAGLLIPAGIGALLTGTWIGALHGFLWGGLVRIFLVHHATWSINSVCHLWGRRPFRCSDESRNNAICGILALGEGWHNNHHAFPTSARHGLRWWEFDASYLVIRMLEWSGLAWQVRVPSSEATAAKRA